MVFGTHRAVCFLFLVAGLAALAGILCLLAGFLIWVLTLLAGLLIWILTLLTWSIVGQRVSFRSWRTENNDGKLCSFQNCTANGTFLDVPNAVPSPGRPRLVHISMLATQQRRQYLVANE